MHLETEDNKVLNFQVTYRWMHYYALDNRLCSSYPEARTQENYLKEITQRLPDSQNSQGWQASYRDSFGLSKAQINEMNNLNNYNHMPRSQPNQLQFSIYSNDQIHNEKPTPRLGDNQDGSLKYLSAVDGYNTILDSPKASMRMQETMKFNTDFSNGFVDRTIKAVEAAEVNSQGRNLQVELELSGLKLFDLEKKIDNCLSSSRNVLNLNSRISPNVSIILSHSASKERLMQLQSDYVKINRGCSSISPKKSLASNVKTSINMTNNMSLNDITVSMSPDEREKFLVLDRNLNQTKANCMLSPGVLTAKQYLENKENPLDPLNNKKFVGLEDKGKIATIKKPAPLGKAVESQNSLMKIVPASLELTEKDESEYSTTKYRREILERSGRILSGSTGHEEKELRPQQTEILRRMNENSAVQENSSQNKWMSSLNDTGLKNEDFACVKAHNGEISFRNDFKVEKNLFKEHFETSSELKLMINNEETKLVGPQKNRCAVNHYVSQFDEATQKMAPSSLVDDLGILKTQNSHISELKMPLIHPEKRMLENEKINTHFNSNDKQEVLQSLIYNSTETNQSQLPRTQNKQAEKFRETRAKEEINESQYSKHNRSYEKYDRSNRTNYLEKSHEKPGSKQKQLQSLLAKNDKINLEIDKNNNYRTQSDYKNKKREIENSSTLRVESEPGICIEKNTIEREIQSFLKSFDSEENKLIAKEWLKKLIDGKNTVSKSLEIYPQSSKQPNTPQKAKEKSITKKIKNNNSIRPFWNYAKKREVTVTKSNAQLSSPFGRSASQKSLGSGAKSKIETEKRQIKSSNTMPDQDEMRSTKVEVNLTSGFKRKKIDSNSNSGMNEEEMKKLSDRLNNPVNVNLAKNLEYLQFLRKDVVRSINYIEKSIQDLSHVSAESETSLEAKSA